LPDGFLERCRSLHGAAVVHIPKAKREELAAAFADCLEGTLEADETWATLQQALFKVVLYGIPSGITADAELAARMTLWSDGRWEELLQRVEAQASQRGGNIERDNESKKRSAKAARARRLAREGAHSKAVAGLRGGIKTMSVEDQRRYAGQLFPRSSPGRPGRQPHPDVSMGVPSSERTAPPNTNQPNRGAPEAMANGAEDEWARHPLKGISFKPMSGTGPSSCRPEHIQDLLSVRKRALKRRLFRLLERAVENALDGTLPQACRWILDTSATFLDKQGTDTPRPIRAGEWLRKAIAKVLLRRNRSKIQSLMLRFGQLGVAIPGGAETLYHARTTIEELAANGTLGPVAVVDLDLVNFFGSVEWDAILDTYADLFQEGYAWESWCTREPCEVKLPSGDRVAVDRGAGQGEPDGPLKASLTLGRAVERSGSDLEPDCKFADGWYIDDGKLCCRPWFLDRILRAIDARLAEMGATRGSRSQGHNIKSSVRVFARAEDAAAIQGWDTPYVQDTCKVRVEGEASKYLGGVLGSRDQVGANFASTVLKTGALHDAIGEIDDPATQMVLRGSCADVSRVMYELRLNGDQIETSESEVLGQIQRTGVAFTLGGDIGDLAWAQATAGRKQAGMGLRAACEVALPAFVASRTASRCGVRQLFKRLEDAGLGTEQELTQSYDQRTDRAVQKLETKYSDQPTLIQEFRHIIAKGAELSTQWWEMTLAGGAPEEAEQERGGRPGAGLLGHGDGREEDSEDSLPNLKHAPGIQKHLSRAIDRVKLTALSQRYEEEGSEEDVRRLRDLADEKNQDFSWWERLNPEVDRVLSAEDWVLAVRTMLGAPHLVSDGVCGCCGEHRLDSQCYHALCCARSESTIGHNRIRDCIAEAFHTADPGTAIEVPGLCPSAPTLRPADVLTRAAHPTLTVAIDVGVRAPHASSAGADAAETMRRDKLDYYEPHLEDLLRQGIVYKPLTFTAYGRRHPDATNILHYAATAVARQRGGSSAIGLQKHWQRQLAAEIWRRAARMVRTCLPRWQAPTTDSDDEEEEDAAT